jgi:hypothetical protein
MSGPPEQHTREHYDRLVEQALKSVVRDSLHELAEKGFLGDQHFYVSFLTNYPGVMIADVLRAQYAEQMTIVLQHQFYNLEVDEHHFEVTLSFNKKLERLFIPFDAVVSFADPSVGFGLQFQPSGEPASTQTNDPHRDDDDPETPDDTPDGSEPAGQVISLDAFRKKT